MTNQAPLQCADILWQTDAHGNSVPVSQAFDDVYFSKAGGLDETCHVFLSGNHLDERFAGLDDHDHFVIMETGFGTGLNFLATCRLWASTAPPTARLYFVSTEKFPLSPDDLAKALSIWQDDPDLRPWIGLLLDNYPPLLRGVHRLEFGQVVLDLWFGDASDSFGEMSAQADAWFLDGFAPSKNDDLWSPAVFQAIKRLSKPNATLATFSCAGVVKRSLADIGMTLQKAKGFGRKREMLTAHFTGTPNPKPKPKTALVIGCGVSGLFSAYALAERGIKVTLVDKAAPLAGASGNPRALFSPKLSLLDSAHHHLPTVSFLYAQRVYQAFNKLANDEIFKQTGVIDFLLPHKKTHDKLSQLVNSYPDDIIAEQSTDDPDHTRQVITTFIAKAGLISPQHLAQFILAHANIHFSPFNVKSISETDTKISITDDAGQILSADLVVICAGFESHLLHDTLFNPRKIRGQVSWLPTTLPMQTPIKYDGYCAVFDKTFLMGASFVRNCTDTATRLDEHQFNLDKLSQSLPNLAKTLNININDLQGRASIRAQTPDYHPVMGQVAGQSRLFTLYGMGSKGFSFAPLCADVLVGQIMSEPLAVTHTLLAKLSAQRARLQTPLTDNF